MKAEEFDKIFDDNEEDIIEYLDLSTIRRPNLEPKRINIDFPTWMVKKLDEEAQYLGISRQAIIKTWLADKLIQSYLSLGSGTIGVKSVINVSKIAPTTSANIKSNAIRGIIEKCSV